MSIHESIRRRRVALGWSHQRLADEVSRVEGLTKPLTWQTVQQWENGVSAPKRTRLPHVAAALLCTPEDLLRESSLTEDEPPDQQAHSMSLSNRRLPPELIEWGALVRRENVGDEFQVDVPDGALHPEVQEGWRIQCNANLEPVPGDDVIVRDKDGGVHLRRFRQGRAGTWKAVALDDNYVSFSSDEDGLEVVAVVSFCMVPRGGHSWKA